MSNESEKVYLVSLVCLVWYNINPDSEVEPVVITYQGREVMPAEAGIQALRISWIPA